MNIAAPQPARPLPVPVGRLVRLSVGQYHRLIEGGILPGDARVELLDGYLVAKMTPNPPHMSAVTVLAEHLYQAVLKDWVVRIQGPITLKESQPEPDLAVVAREPAPYKTRHPTPREVALVIEVADTSLVDDRRYKGELYARARLPEYWIVHLVDGAVEVYTGPKGGKTPAYRDRTDYGRGDAAPLILGGQAYGTIAVNDLMP